MEPADQAEQKDLFAAPFTAPMKRPKNLPQHVMRFCWKKLQEGTTTIRVPDTQNQFLATAQQVSKAVRRFNETGSRFNWPGLHFSAKVLGVYEILIKAEPEMIEKTA